MRKQVLAVTIGVLLVLSVFSVLQFWQIEPVYATSTFGLTSIGGSEYTWAGSNNTYRCLYTLSETADISELHLYTRRSDSGTMSVWMGIYNETDSTRYYLSDEVSGVTNAYQWINFTVSPVVRLTAGDYRFAWNCSQSWDFRYDSGSIAQYDYRNNIWFPSPFGSVDGISGMAVSVYANYTIPDIITPSNVGWSNPFNGTVNTFHANWTATVGTMSYYIFGHNNTGTFTNSSETAFSGTWTNQTVTNNATDKNTVQWEVWANDTEGTWANTGLQNLTLSSVGLRAHDNQLIDRNGNVTVLKGGDYTYFIDDENGSWTLPDGDVQWSTYNTTTIDYNLDMWQTWGCTAIRVLGTTQLWMENRSGYIEHIKYFVEGCKNRSMNVLFTFWKNNVSGTLASIPWRDDGNNIINSTTDFQNLWHYVFSNLSSYSNMVFEFWNEPNSGTPSIITEYFGEVQTWITYARANGVYQLLDVPWDGPITYDFGTTYEQNWDWITTYPLTDIYQSLIYDMHCYRDNCYNSATGYTLYFQYDNVTTWLNVTDTFTYAATVPLMVGEIGADRYHNQTEEPIWYNNTLYWFNQYGIGYCGWALPPWGTDLNIGTAWSLINGNTQNVPVNMYGQILAYYMHNNHPFVWSTGVATDYYSNSTNTGQTWSSSTLNVTVSGSCQVRFFWNQSNVNNDYPINNTLYIRFSNNTVVQANTLFNSTYNLCLVMMTTSGSVAMGYNLGTGETTAQVIVNVWWGSYW